MLQVEIAVRRLHGKGCREVFVDFPPIALDDRRLRR
jgi:hypothetical protein